MLTMSMVRAATIVPATGAIWNRAAAAGPGSKWPFVVTGATVQAVETFAYNWLGFESYTNYVMSRDISFTESIGQALGSEGLDKSVIGSKSGFRKL